MVKSVIWAAALVVLMVFFVGCSDSPAPFSPVPTGESIIEGYWVGQGDVTGGNMASVGQRFDLTMTVSQVGNGVTGTVMDENGSVFDLAGTVKGQSLTFTLTQDKPCAGTFTGSATAMNGDTKIIGDYSGNGCRGSITAEFKTALREQGKQLKVNETTRVQK